MSKPKPSVFDPKMLTERETLAARASIMLRSPGLEREVIDWQTVKLSGKTLPEMDAAVASVSRILGVKVAQIDAHWDRRVAVYRFTRPQTGEL